RRGDDQIHLLHYCPPILSESVAGWLSVPLSGRSAITSSTRPTRRVSAVIRVSRESTRPSRTESSCVNSARRIHSEGLLRRYPERRIGSPVSISSHSSPLISPLRFLRGVIRKTQARRSPSSTMPIKANL